jgi:hypothetical protein
MHMTPRLGAVLVSVLTLLGSGAVPSTAQELPPDLPPVRTQFGYADKATCGLGDAPESGLQGQVPKELRAAGFKGFRCNLQLMSQYQGEGAEWVGSWWGNCFYMSTASGPGADRPGVAVVDVSDPNNARYMKSLTTPGMLTTWESLKSANGLLAGTQTGSYDPRLGGKWFDIYDVSQDCTDPILKSSVELGPLASGHEGNFAPDGRTYYATPLASPEPYVGFLAVDVSEPEQPRVIATWDVPSEFPRAKIHGLGVSRDGNIGYLTLLGNASSGDNGVIIVDLSQIQARVPNPQVSVISTLYWRDGSSGQMAEEFQLDGRTYIVDVDENGFGNFKPEPSLGQGISAFIRGWPVVCDGFPKFGYARIIDVTYPRVPTEVSKLRTEVQDPRNCPKLIDDTSPMVNFGYSAHYCTVDNPAEATAIACGFFEQGIRVFDIRDPYSPKEIAYYNPPANPANSVGLGVSVTAVTPALKGSRNNDPTADWASSAVHFYHRMADDSWELWTQTQQNGVQILKFTNGVYPLQ